MKIRLVKDVTMKAVPTVKLLAGAEVEARPDVAAEWIKGGYAIPVEETLKTEKAVLPPVEKRQGKKQTSKN
jgi:hypothetical protein